MGFHTNPIQHWLYESGGNLLWDSGAFRLAYSMRSSHCNN